MSNPVFMWVQADAYQSTGCYNILCSGFIQTSNEIAIGATINPVSDLDGPQYDINILVWRVSATGPHLFPKIFMEDQYFV